MSQKELESFEKFKQDLDEMKSKSKWQLSGGSSMEKEPSEAKNRSELNLTYTVNNPPPVVVETPNMDEKLPETDNNDDPGCSGISQIKPMSEL